MKKTLGLLSVAALTLSAVGSVFAQEGPINVVSREEGSGTRGAFVEIVGVVDENEDDMTTVSAVIQNGTNGVMQTVAGDPSSIGYISLGSLDDTVKAVVVEGAEATPENVSSGAYPIARPFLVAWGDDLSDVASDFLTFIHSQEGQTIVEGEGYIAVAPAGEEEAAAEGEETEEAAGSVIDSLPAYEAQEGLEGSVEVVGSTSVSPVMEVLAEEYMALNEGVQINITSNGSSAGIQAAQEGAADLGMSSRNLTEEEDAALNSDRIAMDGIAVVVNNENPVEELSLDVIRQIFLGEITEWEAAQ